MNKIEQHILAQKTELEDWQKCRPIIARRLKNLETEVKELKEQLKALQDDKKKSFLLKILK